MKLQWTLIVSLAGLAISATLLGLFIYHRRKVEAKLDELRAGAEPGSVVSTADKTEILDSIEATRRHISSNHDEIDGEIRLQNEKLGWIQTKLQHFFGASVTPMDSPGPEELNS